MALALVALVGDGAMARPAKKAPPATVAEVRAQAPKARVARRMAFVVFARSDRAALDERRRALKEALALADREGEAAVRLTLKEQLAGLEDAGGDHPAAVKILKGALAAGGPAATRLAWAQAEDEAFAVVAALDFDAAFAAGERPTLPTSWSTVAKAWRERPAKASKARAPRGSTFALRQALADLVSDERRGLQPAFDDGKVRAGLQKRLGALGSARGPRDTAGLRAVALETRAALWLVDGRPADAALDLLRADRLRALDPGAAVDALPPPLYAGTVRTRGLCLALEQRRPVVSCDALEEQKLGGVSFVDGSRGPEGPFSSDEAARVLADYDVLLQRCLKQGAKDNLTTQTVVQLEWGIGNDGLVKGHDLRPMRLRGTSVETCLQEALSRFRFPRYPGEMQHLRIDFEVGGEL